MKELFRYKTALLIIITLFITSCGGSGDGTGKKVIPISKPTNVIASSDNGDVTISWSSLSTVDYDLYIATEDGFNFENYASFDGSQWIKNVESPYIFKPDNYSKVYFFSVVAKSGSQESEQSEIVSSIPRYVISGANVTDLKTSLIWARCSVGQIWSETNKTCEGEPTRLSHEESLALISSLEGNWRLPSVIELLSLIYCSNSTPDFFLNTDNPDYLKSTVFQGCDTDNLTLPTIVSNIFPNTKVEPTNLYRTNSKKYYSEYPFNDFYYSVSFKRGGLSSSLGSEPTAIFLRLVKDFSNNG